MTTHRGGGIQADDTSPLFHGSETLSSASTGLSTPFQVDGKGVVTTLITLPDTTSADGEFYACIADAQADFAAGNYKQLTVPIVSKTAGAALTAEPLQVDKPGAPWMCYRYVRSSGGAADEITLDTSAW